MSRWLLTVPVALLLTAFAGCIEEGSLPQGDDQEGLIWAVPELPHIDAKELLANHKTFVKAFPVRAHNVPTHLQARDALAKEFEDAGFPVWRQKFTTGLAQENICAVKMGVGAPNEWVVVGGHYDTTTWDSSDVVDGVGLGPNALGPRASEGAYDDGSGTRITVEIAKAFAHIDTYYSVLFCAFDGEERGLEGSKAVFGAMQDGSFPYTVDATRGMVDFDMFGICYPIRAPIYFDQNDPVLKAKVDEIRKSMGVPDDLWRFGGPSLYVPVVGVSRALGQSDYASWYNSDDPHIPTAFFISDFSELGVPANGAATPSAPGVYPWWHWQDTVETMTQMAGGQAMLEQGFQTATDLGVATLALFALHPEIEFTQEATE